MYASLLCARAVPRCSWSVHALSKGIATARGLSLSARGRGATYQLRPPRTSRCSRGRRERATTLAVSREEAQHASLVRARVEPRWLWSAHALGKDNVPTRGPFPSARGRGVT